GLGDPDRHPGAGGVAGLPHELWARSAVCTIGHCLDRLRRADRRPTLIRAARRGLVDRRLRDYSWDHVHRGLLRGALCGFEPGLSGYRSGLPACDLPMRSKSQAGSKKEAAMKIHEDGRFSRAITRFLEQRCVVGAAYSIADEQLFARFKTFWFQAPERF